MGYLVTGFTLGSFSGESTFSKFGIEISDPKVCALAPLAIDFEPLLSGEGIFSKESCTLARRESHSEGVRRSLCIPVFTMMPRSSRNLASSDGN
jgi:hypothetical protein